MRRVAWGILSMLIFGVLAGSLTKDFQINTSSQVSVI
jgi:hypothetical protein